MPPKDTRMAAALDAMGAMGFPRNQVRQKVNELLKVYTRAGWHLIEEDAYRVLLEALLEDQSNENGNASLEISRGEMCAETTAGPSSRKDASPKNSSCRNHAEFSEAGPSLSKVASQKNSSCGNYAEISEAGPSLSKFASPKSSSCENHAETSEAGPSSSKNASPKNSSCGNHTETLEAGPASSKVVSVRNDASGGSEGETSGSVPSSLNKVFLPCSNLAVANSTVNDVLYSALDIQPLNSTSLTQMHDADNCLSPTYGEIQDRQEAPATPFPQQVDSLPTCRRRPYHGWVGCDDDDFIILPAAPLEDVLRQMFILTPGSRKRQRRSLWDVRPENM